MQIERNSEPQQVSLKEIESGNTFLWNGYIYLRGKKAGTSTDYIWCLRLNDGDPINIGATTLVTPIFGKFVED